MKGITSQLDIYTFQVVLPLSTHILSLLLHDSVFAPNEIQIVSQIKIHRVAKCLNKQHTTQDAIS